MPTAHVTHPVLHVNDYVVVLGDGEDVDAVTLQISSEVSHRCRRCGEELTDTVDGFTSDDSGPSCPDNRPDDAGGRFTGRLILHVPDPKDLSPHMRLTAIRPGTFLIGDPAGPVSISGGQAA